MTITEFLLARVAEDEATAVNVTRFEIRDGIPGSYVIKDRVLAECEAKRQIVRAESWFRQRPDVPAHVRGTDHDGPFVRLVDSSIDDQTVLTGDAYVAFVGQWYEPSPPSTVLRALAGVYADHPDYDTAWRP